MKPTKKSLKIWWMRHIDGSLTGYCGKYMIRCAHYNLEGNSGPRYGYKISHYLSENFYGDGTKTLIIDNRYEFKSLQEAKEQAVNALWDMVNDIFKS